MYIAFHFKRKHRKSQAIRTHFQPVTGCESYRLTTQRSTRESSKSSRTMSLMRRGADPRRDRVGNPNSLWLPKPMRRQNNPGGQGTMKRCALAGT